MSGKENYIGEENKNEDAPTGWEGVAEMAGKMSKSEASSEKSSTEAETAYVPPIDEKTQFDGDEGSTADIDMPPAPTDGNIDTDDYDEDAIAVTGGGVELSGSELVKAFADSRKNFESYAEETSDKTIEEIAPTFVEDEAFFNQAMHDLMGG